MTDLGARQVPDPDVGTRLATDPAGREGHQDCVAADRRPVTHTL